MAITIDLTQALTNFASIFADIKNLIVAASYIIGLLLVFKGFLLYRTVALQTQASAQKAELAPPILHLIAGVVLMYLGPSVALSLETVFGSTTLGNVGDVKSFLPSSDSDKWTMLLSVLNKYFYLLGLISFIKGWLILSKLGHANGQQGATLGKALTHIIGGILLINIINTLKLLSDTFGIL